MNQVSADEDNDCRSGQGKAGQGRQSQTGTDKATSRKYNGQGKSENVPEAGSSQSDPLLSNGPPSPFE